MTDTTPDVFDTASPETLDYPPVNGAFRGVVFALLIMGLFTCLTVAACNLVLYALAGAP